ncbi:Protein of unknown function DUF4817 [Cinara cedri]|uniref:DUF4817 domain-containing protein n=1 Tax=Cinara cedri TaxID=506608 RepID=A0A5E4N801_9HEMI|nr:Protein of unknown function DUF4817 [Cinara cedri]
MERLSPAQRLQIIQLYYENQRSTRAVFRKLRETYGPHDRPTEHTIRYTIVKFETQFSLLDNIRLNRPHPARSEENITVVAGSVRDDRNELIRRRSQQLGLSEWVLEKIEENPLFSTNILFSDEAHFWLNGYVNKQNFLIWTEE